VNTPPAPAWGAFASGIPDGIDDRFEACTARAARRVREPQQSERVVDRDPERIRHGGKVGGHGLRRIEAVHNAGLVALKS
jgi:hypothetical protein